MRLARYIFCGRDIQIVCSDGACLPDRCAGDSTGRGFNNLGYLDSIYSLALMHTVFPPADANNFIIGSGLQCIP